MLVPHELSHLATALALRVEARPPVFILVFLGVIGITRVRRCDEQRRRAIALSGPVTGMLMAIAIMGIGGCCSLLLFWIGTTLLLGEAGHLLIGPDRKVMDDDDTSITGMDAFN